MSASGKRILYIWQAAYPWDVRVEKICVSLARQGFEVEILARRAPGEPVRASDQGVAIHRVGPASSAKALRALSLPVPGNPVWARAIEERIRDFRPALVIARDIPLALPTAAACARHRIPWVIDMAEHYPVAMRTWKKYQANPVTRFAINTLRLPDRIEERSVRLATGILPVIDEQKDRLVREYACDPARIVPIPNTPELKRLPKSLEPRGKGANFGYHGVVIEDRDLATVLRGFDLAATRHPDITLTVAGSGESAEELQRLASGLTHGKRIRFTGRYRPEELETLYSQVDFGIVPWKVNDFTNNTIANKFYDYAAFGKPVVFTKTRPMVRLMESMRFGFGYEGSDPEACSRAMLELVSADYGKLARNGRAAVEREHNWDADSRKMVDFLNQLISS